MRARRSLQADISDAPDLGLTRAPRRSKFGVDLTSHGKAERTVNGRLFASKREAARYMQLVWMERQGLISGLHCQERYSLVVNGVRVGAFTADFTYLEGGAKIVEDAKGVRTPVYRLKALLMFACHGIRIRET